MRKLAGIFTVVLCLTLSPTSVLADDSDSERLAKALEKYQIQTL